ncbi:MAG TPA: hypothetical protein VMH86_09105 [Rhizomicrobium sp.]|nr:hypothetical protein [Rhizomicrobium sp.]
MTFRFRSAAIAAAAIAASGLVISFGALAAKSNEGPQVEYVPANSSPPPPAGLKVTCMNGPNTLQSAKTCPVLKYLGDTTWAYSYIDNRVSLAFVTYDSRNNVVLNQNKDGARYVWNMISSYNTRTVQAFGQANQYVTLNWSDLVPPPTVVAVASNSIPSVPSGLKVTCMVNGQSLQPGSTCPVAKVGNYTTWALSYIDNRVSLAFVTFDGKGAVVRNVEAPGTRYVWQMTVNTANKTVVATGQGNATVSTPWSNLGPATPAH